MFVRGYCTLRAVSALGEWVSQGAILSIFAGKPNLRSVLGCQLRWNAQFYWWERHLARFCRELRQWTDFRHSYWRRPSWVRMLSFTRSYTKPCVLEEQRKLLLDIRWEEFRERESNIALDLTWGGESGWWWPLWFVWPSPARRNHAYSRDLLGRDLPEGSGDLLSHSIRGVASPFLPLSKLWILIKNYGNS